MTSLLLLILSIFVALGFARYNKSNKLFWIILVSLLLGFTGKSMVNYAFVDHKSEASTVKASVNPMLTPTCSFQALEPSEAPVHVPRQNQQVRIQLCRYCCCA